jgi:hypothetical protein
MLICRNGLDTMIYSAATKALLNLIAVYFVPLHWVAQSAK